MSHVRPDGSYYSTIFEEYGLDRFEMQYGEILCWGQTSSAEKAMDAWRNSEGHFESMSASIKTLVGVGVAQGNSGYYFCQIFTNKD